MYDLYKQFVEVLTLCSMIILFIGIFCSRFLIFIMNDLIQGNIWEFIVKYDIDDPYTKYVSAFKGHPWIDLSSNQSY